MTAATDTSTTAQETNSYHQIFASTFIIGGASVMNILIGLVRTKAVALLLGPAGVGLIGLLGTLMTTAATVAQMGVATVGTRQIAEALAAGDPVKLATSRRALLMATLVLAALGGAALWALQVPLAKLTIGDATSASSVGLLALGVAFSIAAAAQAALVRGMRRLTDLASITVLGAIATTVVGVPMIWWLGTDGITAYVVLGPLASFVVGYCFVARLPRTPSVAFTFADLRPHLPILWRLGIPFMGAAAAATLVELWIRIDVQRQLGSEGLGQFQASWTIAAQYVGFVLGAMGADYYPRLTTAMRDPAEATSTVNQQTEVALLLSGPAILAMFGLAPFVVELLYSAEFAPAADVLRWQALADGLKVASWPLGFIVLAAGAGRTFFMTETVTLVLMAGLLHALIGRIGLQGAGVAYFAASVLELLLVYWLAVRRISFRWSRSVKCALGILIASVGVLGTVIMIAPRSAVPATLLSVAVFGGYALRRIQRMGLGGIIGAGLARARMFEFRDKRRVS